MFVLFSLKSIPFNEEILGVFLGYEDYKGYSFSVSDGLRAKVITFGEIEDSTIIKKYDLKNPSLVGTSFHLVYETGTNDETGLMELNLISIEKTLSPDTLAEKHN